MAEIISLQDRDDQGKKQLARLIQRFNRKYAVVNDGGEMRVFWQREDPLRNGYWTLHRFTFADFYRLHQNRRLTIRVPDPKNPGKMKDVTQSVATWWLNDPRRREYLGGLVFDPTNSVGSEFWNLWQGLAIAPVRGSWELLQKHIFQVICAGEREHFEFLLNWTARMLQHPEVPAETCVVLQGDEGVGKGLFGRALLRIFGQHGLHLSHPEHLRSKHNAHLWYCVFLFADEAFYAGDKQHESILKALVTEEDLAVEPKHKPLFQAPNYLHILMSSNKDWVVPASLQARRWFVLRVGDQRRGDTAYFNAIYREMEAGGLAAMLFDLLHRDLRAFNPRVVPQTQALAEQKLHSLDSLTRWWMNVLERGFVWRSRFGIGRFSEWSELCTTELLWRSYMQFCDESRIYQRQTRIDLGKFMSVLYPATRPRQRLPIFEVEALPPIGRQHDHERTANEPVLPLETLPGAAVVADIDPLEKLAVVSKSHQAGYRLGSLEEARARFMEVVGDLPMAW
jgi:hypothetical protein